MTNEVNVKSMKKQRKEIFNMGLYIEALKRIRLPGIILFVVLAIEAVLIPLGYEMNYILYKLSPEVYGGDEYLVNVVHAMQLHPMLLFVIVGAFVFAWTSFSFLNKRNASDFYHSIPHTRLSLYFSNVAAIVTWIFGTVLTTGILSRLTAAMCYNAISVIEGTYLSYMAGCLAASLLVAACVIIGKVITGTLFSNLVVTWLIMFFPRFVISIMSYAVTIKFPMIPAEHISPLLSSRINILSGMSNFLYSILTSDEPCLLQTSSQIYTTVLAVVYILIGAILFVRRKSETAQRSAPNRLMQALYRITLGFAVGTPICFVIYIADFEIVFKLFFVGVLVSVTALAYFIYEIVTTRKWKNLLRAIPGYFIVLGLNAALIFSMFLITTVEKSFSPDADDIVSIQYVSESDNYENTFDVYVDKKAEGFEITDREVLETIASCLDESRDFLEAYGGLEEYYRDDESYQGSFKDDVQVYTIRIKTKLGITKYRNIRLYKKDRLLIESAREKMPEYDKAWVTLPTPQKGTVTMGGIFEVKNSQAKEIFDIFAREVTEVDLDKWVEFNMISRYEYEFGWFGYITGGKYIDVPFDAELFPKSTEKLMEFVQKNSEDDLDKIKKEMSKYGSVEISYMELIAYEDGMYQYYSADKFGFEGMSPEGIMSKVDDSSFEYGDTYLCIELCMSDNKENVGLINIDSKYSSFLIRVNDDIMEEIEEYFYMDNYIDEEIR